jgi:hypothetical protein
MSKHPELELTNFVRAIPDFPKPGILFRDITPLLGDPKAFAETIERMADLIRSSRIYLRSPPSSRARGCFYSGSKTRQASL